MSRPPPSQALKSSSSDGEAKPWFDNLPPEVLASGLRLSQNTALDSERSTTSEEETRRTAARDPDFAPEPNQIQQPERVGEKEECLPPLNSLGRACFMVSPRFLSSE